MKSYYQHVSFSGDRNVTLCHLKAILVILCLTAMQLLSFVLCVVADVQRLRQANTSISKTENHLWFRGVNTVTDYGPAVKRCGEVDAAPRMPASIFEPQNALALAEYARLTCELYSAPFDKLGKLSVGRCADIGFGKKANPERMNGVAWAPRPLMGPVCKKKCNCDYSTPFSCKDVPDQPDVRKWCSLCGPKYNSDAVVALYLEGPAPVPPPVPTKNIVQLAQSVPTLSALVSTLVAANLTGVLSTPGPFTVFAPNNDAFDKIPAATLAKLLQPKNIKTLQQLLQLHVASGPRPILAADLYSYERVKTVDGQQISVTLFGRDDEIMLTTPGTQFSKVIAVDNAAVNGVVHIIDTVLLPN